MESNARLSMNNREDSKGKHMGSGVQVASKRKSIENKEATISNRLNEQ
jgi:hypothetical protein